jgi:hypothetical protein
MKADRQDGDRGAGETWAAMGRLREQWLLIVALASALFLGRDMVESYAHLPEEVARQGREIAGLGVRMGWMEAVAARWPAIADGEEARLPGHRFGLGTLRRGEEAAVRWPGEQGPAGCRLTSASGVMRDAGGQWYPVPVTVREAGGAPVLGLRADAAMRAGPALLRLRLARDCPDRHRIEISPWLMFTLLGGNGGP